MLLRRTPLSIRGDVSSATITAVAGIMATELGWTPERKAREIETFIRDLADYHGVSREALERRTRDRSDVCA
jgi:glycerol-3-phosphate dehydrogenase